MELERHERFGPYIFHVFYSQTLCERRSHLFGLSIVVSYIDLVTLEDTFPNEIDRIKHVYGKVCIKELPGGVQL